MTAALRDTLRSRLLDLGFDAVRFVAAETPGDTGFRSWIEASNHADMEWLARSVEKRENPQLVLAGARTVVVLGINYWPGREVVTGGFARYALHSDYHDTIKPGLVAAGRELESVMGIGPDDYRYYVDAGPILERGWAAASGLGFRGKHGNVISRTHGNWLILAAIVVRAEIMPDSPASYQDAGKHCGKCIRCMSTCPTGAITAPGIVDARRCISYHTIENRGFVPAALRAHFGTRVFGCDDCLEVCPWNRFAQEAYTGLLDRRFELGRLGLLELLTLTPESFRELFRRTAVKRTKLAGLLRNACIAAGNRWAGRGECGDREVLAALAALHRLVTDESRVVRGHAVWAIRRILGDARAMETLGANRETERDQEVLAEYPD